MKSTRKLICLLLLIWAAPINRSYGQQLPYYPISYRIFSPFVFNPAIAGSKDFSSVDLLISNYGKYNSQIASGNLRLSKSRNEYFSALPVPEFKHVGVGGYLFNDVDELSHNIGIGGTASYHLQLDKNALSYLSFGVSAKAVLSNYSGDPDLNKPAKKMFFPNFDAGIYYYSTCVYAGISATNLLGNPDKPDSLGFYTIPVTRQFFFLVGYKLVLNRSLNLLLEPSLIVNSDDTFSGKISKMLKPGLKLYAGNYCIGTYFNDFNNTSFFFQYKYSKIYVGTYFELPNNSSFYKRPIIAEFALGLNISAVKWGFSRGNHW